MGSALHLGGSGRRSIMAATWRLSPPVPYCFVPLFNFSYPDYRMVYDEITALRHISLRLKLLRIKLKVNAWSLRSWRWTSHHLPRKPHLHQVLRRANLNFVPICRSWQMHTHDTVVWHSLIQVNWTLQYFPFLGTDSKS